MNDETEMKSDNAKTNTNKHLGIRITGIVFILLGVLVFALWLRSGHSKRHIMETGKPAEGVAQEVEVELGESAFKRHHVDLTFRTSEGRTLTVKEEISSDILESIMDQYDPFGGDDVRIPIKYDPSDPTKIWVVGNPTRDSTWLAFSIFLVVLGAFFFFLTFFAGKLQKIMHN